MVVYKIGMRGGIRRKNRYCTKQLSDKQVSNILLHAAAKVYNVHIGTFEQVKRIREFGDCHQISEVEYVLLIPNKAYVLSNIYYSSNETAYMEISLVCTAKNARRRGFSEKLLRAMLLFAHYKGIRVIMSQTNNAMGRVLKRMNVGFVVNDESLFMKNWGDWTDWQTSPTAILNHWRDTNVPKNVSIIL